MGNYRDFHYGSGEMYGGPPVGSAPVSVTCTGFHDEGAGMRIVGRARITVGPLPKFATGTRVLVMYSHVYWPSVPDVSLGRDALGALFPSRSSVGGGYWEDVDFPKASPVLAAVVYGTPSSGGGTGGAVVVGPGWTRTWTEKSMNIPLNSVLYVRVFASEPPVADASGGPDIERPWRVVGQDYAVIAGNYGGVNSAVAALPMAFRSDGETFSAWTIDELRPTPIDSPTLAFSSAPGFLADLLQTDGALISDRIDRLHPAMVFPLLRAAGLTKSETSALQDRYLESRAKALLYDYRVLQVSRGRAVAVSEYFRILSGYRCRVVRRADGPTTPMSAPDTGPVRYENMLTALQEACPFGDPELDMRGNVVGTSLSFSRLVPGSAPDVPTLASGDLHDDRWACPDWTDEWVRSGQAGTGTDTGAWTNDRWHDRWSSWDPGTDDASLLALSAPVIPAGDSWHTEEVQYEQHTGWAWRLRVSPGGRMGTRMQLLPGASAADPRYDHAYFEQVLGERSFRVRLRARVEYAGASPGSDPASVSVAAVFLDAAGKVLQSPTAPTSPTHLSPGAFVPVESIQDVPAGAAFVGWEATFTTTASSPQVASRPLVSVGAVELRANPKSNAWDGVYRNPRSIVVRMDTATSDVAVDSQTTMESDTVIMDDTTAIMDAGRVSIRPTLSAYDALVKDKLAWLVEDYLPHGVSARIVTGYDAEYPWLVNTKTTP